MSMRTSNVFNSVLDVGCNYVMFLNLQDQQPIKNPRRNLNLPVLPYIKGVSEVLRRSLEQHGVRTVFKSDTTLMPHLVRPKDTLKHPCECGKVYIGETGRAMQERIKEHDKPPQFRSTLMKWGIFLFGMKTVINRDPHWYTRRIK